MDDTTSEPRIVSDLISAGDVLMLTTALDGLLARPVTCAEVDGDTISFLVDGSTDWVMALERAEPVAGGVVGITAANHRATNYAAFAARALVLTDRARAGQIWTPLAQAFFDGPDDPNLRVLDAEVVDGQWWGLIAFDECGFERHWGPAEIDAFKPVYLERIAQLWRNTARIYEMLALAGAEQAGNATAALQIDVQTGDDKLPPQGRGFQPSLE